METYKTIKKLVREGEKPTVVQISKAIVHQTGVTSAWLVSVSKHVGRLAASREHPFPIAKDQKGRIMRRVASMEVEHDRLIRLFYWRELAENAVNTAPVGSA